MIYFKYINDQLNKPMYILSLKQECCHEPNELVINSIQRAKKTIIACVYKFDNIYIFNALKTALERGVEITMVMDYKKNRQNRLAIDLKKLGANIKLWKKTDKLHAKYLILDDTNVLTGSFNLTMENTDKTNRHKVDLIISLYDANAISNFKNIHTDMMNVLENDVCDECVDTTF